MTSPSTRLAGAARIKGGTAVSGTSEVIVTKDKKDYQTNMKLLIDEGAKIIVTYGFALGGDTAIAAKANPDIKFIGIDQFICVDETGRPAKSDPSPPPASARATRPRCCRTTRAWSSPRSRPAISPASWPAA